MPVKTRTIAGEEWLPVGKAASELGYSRATIRRLCDDKHLIWVKAPYSSYRWISRASIEAEKRRFIEATEPTRAHGFEGPWFFGPLRR